MEVSFILSASFFTYQHVFKAATNKGKVDTFNQYF